jgi:hypothetical protein
MKPFWLSRTQRVALPVGLSVALDVVSSPPPHAEATRARLTAVAAATSRGVFRMMGSLSR